MRPSTGAGVHVWNLATQLAVFLLVSGLVAALKGSLASEAQRVRSDQLTGVLSRHGFFEMANFELLRLRRAGHGLSVVYLDVDDFKQVNDTQGHERGDELLRRIGTTLQQELRAVDAVGRLGGDEFALLLPDDGVDGSGAVVARLRIRLAEAVDLGGWRVGFSFGVTRITEPSPDFERVLSVADQQMYVEKRSRTRANPR